ncbi:MAG: GTPase HflX [Myxococcota bacterium]|nr:GTPase HflX [Myxococcota bacterium]
MASMQVMAGAHTSRWKPLLNETRPRADRAILAGLYPHDAELSPVLCLDELESLVIAAAGEVVWRVIQRRGQARHGRRAVDPATWIGRGKVTEIAEAVALHEATLVVFDNELAPNQIRELEKRIGCRVIDRSELILDIFASRARTREARLQVELAQLQYTAPRLRGMWSHLERQAGGGGGKSGGIGTRGPGEQQIEIDRRIVDKRISRLRDELERLVNRREREVIARASRVWTVGLVGYTNAGKSTLLNALTDAGAYAADQLFATLDTVSRRWAVRPGVDIPLSDTVGFVRELPHHLVASFRSTLAEALHADLLLHVVDAAHPDAAGQLEAVHTVLSELGVDLSRVVGVLNKVDAVEDDGVLIGLRHSFSESVTISAKTGHGLDRLAEVVVDRRSQDWCERRLMLPHAEARRMALIHEHGEVLEEAWQDDGWHVRVSVPKAILWQLAPFITP